MKRHGLANVKSFHLVHKFNVLHIVTSSVDRNWSYFAARFSPQERQFQNLFIVYIYIYSHQPHWNLFSWIIHCIQ